MSAGMFLCPHFLFLFFRTAVGMHIPDLFFFVSGTRRALNSGRHNLGFKSPVLCFLCLKTGRIT